MISIALLVMVGALLIRGVWMSPYLAMPRTGPPWELRGTGVPPGIVIVALWLGMVTGGIGVATGLSAVHRGERLNLGLLLAIAAAAAVALTVLPPGGSTDALDYAAYGRIAVLGHSPYVFTPHQLRLLHPGFARSIPREWQRDVSVYGPLATAEQYLAARLGGSPPAVIVWWLKLWNMLAFGAVAIAADRLLRADRARRLRAHLLWTANPLLLWDLIAAGHLDVLAAAAGLLGLILIREPADGGRPSLGRAAVAGALVGAAAGIKINYLLFGLGLAWALRRAPAALAVAAAAAGAVLLAGYSWFGLAAVRAVLRRNAADNFYRFLLHQPVPLHSSETEVTLLAVVAAAAVAVLLLWRLPPGDPGWPAIRPVIAVSAAWLFFWPYQLPWYDTMLVCLLVLYPATRLDWLVLARLTAGAVSNTPGTLTVPQVLGLPAIDHRLILDVTPLTLLGAAIALVLLAISGQWAPRGRGAPPGTVPPGPAPGAPQRAGPWALS